MEVIAIQLSVKPKKSEVVAFLAELKSLLERDDFNYETDILLIKKKKPDDVKHSTPYTLLDLDYDVSDVIERLKELTVSNYSEAMIDIVDLDPPILFVFGHNINSNLVYIKLKIQGNDKKRVICVSFHYAKAEMSFPYA